ncbi:hypothetical protein ACNSOL_11740 (plasmid) [Aliarcobacter lanthieri]|uniref:hypothetical protein n=1 Tax=Aliarcobacter lanthieri TaxID=1355374 RepID=UPI003AACE0A6
MANLIINFYCIYGLSLGISLNFLKYGFSISGVFLIATIPSILFTVYSIYRKYVLTSHQEKKEKRALLLKIKKRNQLFLIVTLIGILFFVSIVTFLIFGYFDEDFPIVLVTDIYLIVLFVIISAVSVYIIVSFSSKNDHILTNRELEILRRVRNSKRRR